MDIDVSLLPFWKDLNDEDKKMVESSAVLKHYDAGQLIHGNCDGGE